MGCQAVGQFGGLLTPLRGRGVVRVKADQKGCGAGGQDRPHKSVPFSEEAIVFSSASQLKYNHNRHFVLPVEKVIIHSWQPEIEGGVDWLRAAFSGDYGKLLV